MAIGEGKRRRSPRRDWRALVEAQADSGESVREFCESRGLSTTYFYARRRELQQSTTSAPHVESTEFVALPVQSPSAAVDVEVSLGDGVVLRVRRG